MSIKGHNLFSCVTTLLKIIFIRPLHRRHASCGVDMSSDCLSIAVLQTFPYISQNIINA